MRMMLSYNGCWLPAFILLNLFFGRLFFKITHWLVIEGVLILLFLLSAYIHARRIFSPRTKAVNVIDVEGKVVEDRDTQQTKAQGVP